MSSVSAVTSTHAQTDTHETACWETHKELICTEVWGGNRHAKTDVQIPGLSGCIYSHPCRGQRGGDIHYLSACSAGLVSRACLADVAGHGEDVADLSTQLHRLLGHHMTAVEPAGVFHELNRHLAAREAAAITTAICFTYSAQRCQLRFCCAGHPPAYVYRRNTGRWATLKLPESPNSAPTLRNLPLGVDERTQFDTGTCELAEGDRIVIVSDGVAETPDPTGKTWFSRQRLLDLLNANRLASPHDLGETILRELHAFAGRDQLDHDDVTFFILEARPKVYGPMIWHMIRNNLRKFRASLAS